jgi:hypothetical protein
MPRMLAGLERMQGEEILERLVNFSLVVTRGARNHCRIVGFAAVAQLDRVLGYEPRGRGFNSCQPHQNVKTRNRKVVGFFTCIFVFQSIGKNFVVEFKASRL